MKKHPLTVFRDQHGLTKTALSERLGVDKSTVSRWENGKRFPPRELWPRIEKITGLSGGDLAVAIAKSGTVRGMEQACQELIGSAPKTLGSGGRD